MTTPENFVSRWARLKRESGAQRGIEPTGDQTTLGAAASVDAETIAAPQRNDEAIEPPFDIASLPSIDDITVDTDIRGFLRSQVPAELTRAALRQAWASDPAIRDFIGIAENQWDFNDPDAIPGFGALSEKDSVQALRQAIGGHERLAEMIGETPVFADHSLPDVTDGGATEPDQAVPDQAVQSTFDEAPSIDTVRDVPDDSSKEDVLTGNEAVAEGEGATRNRRSHGGALPR
jgi:hypothetical protein